MGTQFYNDPEPVNLGTGYKLSIRDLVSLICKLMKFEGKILWETDKPNGQLRRCLDTQRAKQAFGFTAKVTLSRDLKILLIGISRTLGECHKPVLLDKTSESPLILI
jgi:GDP-L-fucose synthase